MKGFGSLLAVWFVATAFGVAMRPDSADAPRLVGQSCFYLALAIYASRQPAIRNLVVGLPRSGRVAIFGSLAALVTFQLADRSVATFPFVTWDMYTRNQVEDPVYYEYTGVTADGSEVEINFAREFVGLQRKVSVALGRMAERARESDDDAAAAELKTQYDSTVKALARNYNSLHPKRSVRVVRIWRHTIPSSPFRGLATIERSLAGELAVD